MHFLDRRKHIGCAGISSQSQVGVEGGFFTQLFMQVHVCVPVAIAIVEGCLREEIREAHRFIDCGAVVIVLVTDFLKGCHALDIACKHLRDSADTEISALFDHLTELFLNIVAPGFYFICHFPIEFIDFLKSAREEVCEDVFSISINIDLTEM